MLLTDVAAKGGWLYSEWKLTYPAGWTNILKGAYALYGSLADPEIIIDGEPAEIKDRQDITALKEAGSLMIRGMSALVHVPLMISFLNQTNAVRAAVASATDEFRVCDYRQFNLSMCQLMDSAELAMFR